MKIEIAQSVIDVRPGFKMTDTRTNKYYSALKNTKKYGDDILCITDVTPHGNYVYGAMWIRVEIDNKHISNERGITLLDTVLKDCKQ